MWGRILNNYDPRGKYALFESISTLYSLKQGTAESISDYMSRACRLFRRLHGITFNTMTILFFIVNSDHSRFGALVNCFQSGNPKVVNADVDNIEILLEAIESCSRVVDSPPTIKRSALCGSAPKSESTPVSLSKTDHSKTTAPPGVTCSSYPTTRPEWDRVTDPVKADKLCCACFRIHMQAQGCLLMSHSSLIVSNNPEGAQSIIAASVDKNKTWE